MMMMMMVGRMQMYRFGALESPSTVFAFQTDVFRCIGEPKWCKECARK